MCCLLFAYACMFRMYFVLSVFCTLCVGECFSYCVLDDINYIDCICVYEHLCVAVYPSPGAREPICRGGGMMASQLRRVGVKLRAPNYSPGSYSLPASPLAPMFGCIFPGRVR